MLRKVRIIVSVIIFALITFYFLDFRDILPMGFSNLAKIQLIPAILTGSFVVLGVLLLLTFIFGRIYCSSICPMGVFQDIATWLSKRISKKKKRFEYTPAKNILRYSVLVISVAAIVLGFPLILGLVEPYSAYGRIVSNIFKPVYLAGNNLLESVFSSFGNYTFYKMEVFMMGLFSLFIAIVTFLGIGFLAWKYGRSYCNTICPVGTILGFISKHSLFKVRINKERCNGCGLCATKCKASCIDSKNHVIDYSRCINCFDCLENCHQTALTFSYVRKQTSQVSPKEEDATGVNRRQFLLTGISTVATVPVVMAQDKIDNLTGASQYKTKNPISPPGSASFKHLSMHCTSCHLCISKCPVNVLKPAFLEYGVGGMMQPRMSFDKGFCNYDCTICSNVCPNGALHPLTTEEKHRTQMGYVVFHEDLCVVHVKEKNCGACAEHCPTQAVTMVPYKDGLTIPHINTDICVGCGGCEFICPARPSKAIVVEGNPVHQEAQAFVEEAQKDIDIEGFGF